MSKLQNQFLETVQLSQHADNFHLSELPFLHGSQLAQIIDGPSVKDVDAVSSSRVHRWIHARAVAQPDAVALYSAERQERITYLELDEQASKIAYYLFDRGIGPGDVVLLHLERGFAIIPWILGTLRAGACYVFLDQSLPPKRKQAIARVSEAVHLVTDNDNIQELFLECKSYPSVTFTHKATDEISEQPATDLPERAKDQDLAISKHSEPE